MNQISGQHVVSLSFLALNLQEKDFTNLTVIAKCVSDCAVQN